jgi:hypothetical protein
MHKIFILFLNFFIVGEAALAQNSYQQRTLDFQNELRGIEEVRSLKVEAANYFFGDGGKKKNKKLACITIQQAYDVELRMGYSVSDTRATVRQYCG